MNNPAQQCAREILETVPQVNLFIFDQIRRQRTAGLLLPQYRALAFLSRIKNSSLSAVAAHLGLSLPSMSRLIDGLVASRLVRRQPVPTNRRQIALTLTVRGRATLEKGRNGIRLQLAGALRDLPVDGQKDIHCAMKLLQKAFDHRAVTGTQSPKAKP
jgi:MarR family transcriptional regulator for hemolysin